MKNQIQLMIVLCLVSQMTLAQTNTFPSSGNAGVGTTVPADQLEVVSGTRKVGFNTPVSGVAPGGILSLSRPDDGTKIMFLGGAAAPNDDGVLYTMGGGTELRLVSGGGAGNGFGFYSNITTASAFGSVRPTPVMKIDGSGNVGIGTATPSSKLDIRGSYIHVVSTLNSYSFLARDSDPGNDSYLYHRISPNFHILGSNKNGTGTMRKLGFGLGGGDTELDIKMTIDNSGFVGIGTTAPSQKLEASGSIFINADNTAFAIDANGSSPRLGFLKKAGAYPVFATAASVPMIFGQSNQTGLFTNIATSVFTERMRIDANGNVGIGSTAPNQKLTVNGTIYGKEVKVDLLVPGPDYVFSKTYSLRSLKDVESYIDEYQHLPEIPSAAQMEKDGIMVGEMNMLLLKKVEELTLYLLEMERRAIKQQAEIEELKTRINK